MTDTTDDGPTDEVDVRPGGSDLPEITCTLTDEEAARRETWVEERLVPHLRDIETRDDGYTVVFERSPEAYAAVAETAWMESQCCSWATFEVELPPGDGPIRWHERSDREAGRALFGDALREFADTLEGVPEPS